MKMNDRTYDLLKWLCLIVLPALATLYATLGKVWGLPYTEQIPLTINAIATFIGVCIGVSTLAYNKEVINFEDEEDGIGGIPEEDYNELEDFTEEQLEVGEEGE